MVLTDGMVCCYTCDETFETKNEMLNHRKNKHESLVRICDNFKDNNCRRQNKFCWFIHKDEEIDTESMEKKNNNKDKDVNEVEGSSLVFQKVTENLKPPIINKNLKSKTE